MAHQPGTAGRKLGDQLVGEHRRDRDLGRDTDRRRARPTCPPTTPRCCRRGSGTSDAIVEMKMLSESSVQKLIEPPNAAMHAPYTAAYMSALIAFPPSSRATRRGERTAAHIVVAAALGGRHRPASRSFGMPRIEHRRRARSRRRRSAARRRSSACRDRPGVERRRRRAATATTSSMTWATMLPTLMSSPPDATADARSTPCFCRNRICAAMPPTAGTARFENDIESCSSAVRMSGRLIGTVPMSAIAVAKLVSSEMIIATISHQKLALVIVSQSSCGLADLAQQREDRDQRADRHHQVGAADAVELLERREVASRSPSRRPRGASPTCFGAPCVRGGGRSASRG